MLSTREPGKENVVPAWIWGSTSRMILTVSALILAVKLAENGYLFSSVCLLLMLALSYPAYVFPIVAIACNSYKKWCTHHRINGVALFAGLMSVLTVVMVVLSTADPAQAMFFKGAEDYLIEKLNIGNQTNQSLVNIISFVFVLMRLTFIIYIGVAIISIVQKGRDNEDWVSLARTPAIVAAAMFIGDALTMMVVGGNT